MTTLAKKRRRVDRLAQERDEAREIAAELRDICRREGLEDDPEEEPWVLPWEPGQ